MGGGGSAGEVEYPAYLEDWHYRLLTNSILPTIGAGEDMHARAFDATNGIFGVANNPYVGVASYDPTTILDTAQDELREAESMLDVLSLMSKSVSLNMSHRDMMKIDLAQGYNRIGATLAAANAVIGTVYPSALAIMEAQYQGVAQEATLKYEYEQTKNKLVIIQTRLDFMRTKIMANMDQTRLDLEYNVEEVLWDTNAYLRLMSAMGTIAGVAATTTQSGNTKNVASVLGGAASGAAMGMSAGPWGAVIGAGVGALTSLMGSA